MKWIKQPDEPGDYLWVVMWSCNCCVLNYGIAHVDVEGRPNPNYTYKVGKKTMHVWFDKEVPAEVTGWLKLNDYPKGEE